MAANDWEVVSRTPFTPPPAQPDQSEWGVVSRAPITTAPAPAPSGRQFVPPGQEDPQAQLQRFLADRESLKREISRLRQDDPRLAILQQELAYTQQGADYYRQQIGKPSGAPTAPPPTKPTEKTTSGLDISAAPEQFMSGVRGMQQSYFTSAAKNVGTALNVMDRIDRGEQVRDIDDPTGYQYMTPQQRAKTRAQFEATFPTNVAKAIAYGAQQQEYVRNPKAEEMIKAANEKDWSKAWKAFSSDPAGVVQQLSVQSAPNALPSLIGGAAGVLLRGGVPAMMAGLATGSFPVEYMSSLVDSLQDAGVDLKDTQAVSAKLRDPKFLEDAGKKAVTRGVVIATADALGGKLAMPLKPKQLGKNIARGGANIATEVGTEMGGEFGAQVASADTIKVGDIIAEGLGAGPQAVASTALRTVEAARAEPQVAPPTAAPRERVEPTFEERPFAPTPQARVEPPIEGAQPTQMQRMFRELEETSGLAPAEAPVVPEAAAPVAEAPSVPPVAETAPPAAPVVEAPVVPPAAPAEAPTPPKAPIAEREFEPAPVRPAGFRAPTPLENRNINSQAVYDLGNGARVHFTYDDFFISAPGSTPGQETGVIRLDDTRKGVFYRPELFPDFIPQEMRQPLIDAQRAVYSEKDLGKKQQIIKDVVSKISQFAPKIPSVEAAPPVAPAEPRGLFAPPQSELPPLPAKPVTAKEPLPDIVVPAGFKAKKGRKPQLVFAARALAEGKITKDQYDEYVERYNPIKEVLGGEMELPIEDALMTQILTKEIPKKKDPKLVNAPIADGTRVGLRMDIPALDWGRENGVNGSVVSIHKGSDPKNKTEGENISYKSTGRVTNVVFAPRSEEDAFKIAQQAEPETRTKKTGEIYLKEVADKKPQQTIEGDWVNTSPEETLRLVREHFNDPNWVQVSLDPLRHSYFYARDSKRPVISADEALQVGRFVLVKNPVYGDRQQFLYNIEPILSRPVTGTPDRRLPSFKREVAKLRDQHTRGLMTDEEFARRIDALIYEDSRRKFEKDIRTLREGRVRGGDYIRQRLLEAVRRGDLSGEAVDLAEWFIINNPQLVEDLGVSIRAPREGGVGGMYSALPRVMFLVKEGGSDNTVVHEILHHLERMMPANVQSAIRREWTKQFLKAQKNAKTPTEQLYFNALSTHHFDNRPVSFDTVPTGLRELFFKTLRSMDIEGGSVDGSALARHLLINSDLDIGNYQYYNPSEFWAVNGSDIVRGRYDAIRGGVLTRLKNWLGELGQKIKSVFGFNSDAPIIRALDSLARSDGRFVTTDLLSQAQDMFSIKPKKKQTDTPEFKRWFGESKVVDENGDPLVVYHSGSFSETEDREFQTEGGVHFGTKRAALDRSVGKAIDDEVKSAEIYEEGGRYYFDENDYPNAPSNGFRTDGDARAWLAGEVNEYYQPGDYEPNLTAAYLSIKNPKRVKDQGENWAAAIAEAKAEGHDGIVYRNEYEDKGKDSYIAFDPTQIKSATGNIGTFDPNEPNILYSIEPEAKPAPREAAPAKTIEPSKINRERDAWIVGRDELGRYNFGLGAKAYDTVARLANIALDKIAMKPISPELSRAMRNMKVQIDKTQKQVGAIGSELSKMSPQERALISDVIEGELKAGVNPPQEVLNNAAAMQSLMTKQSQELVRLGMLSKEAANRWENKYLPRFYEKKLGDETKAWAQAAKRLLMKEPTMQGIKGKQLKSRGMYKNVYVEDLPEWIAQGWEQRDPSFDPKTSTETVVWRDYTREEREKMGEIRDAMFRFVMGYNASQRDIALGRLYENLAENYASKSPAEGLVQVPDTKVEGTGAYRYGKLAGMYVPKEIKDHLVWNDQEMASGLYKLYRAGLGRWKEGKTVLNPTAHANNVFSNFTMAHFAGVSYLDVHKYAGALRDFVKNNDRLKEAEDIGLFTGTFSQAEMVENMPPELKKLANMTESQVAKYGDKAWDLLSLTLEWDGKKYGVRPMMKWMYENEDFFFRYLIYRDARNRGLEPEDAREYSNQFIFTYDDLPRGARVLRDVGMPFFSYTYKVIPVLVRTAIEYPWRFAAPAAAVYTLNALMYSMASSLGGDDDDWWGKVLYKYATDEEFRKNANKLEEEERKNLPPWMKGKSSLGTEKAVRLGMDDVTGLPLFLDISRIFPGGDLLDAENNAGGVALLQPFVPSNPVFTSLVAMLANKDMFLGKDIVNEKTDTSAEQARKRAAWLWKQWAPAISVGNYHFDRAMNTIANMTGEPVTIDAGPMGTIDYTGVGKDGLPVIPKYAAMQTFGIKVRPYDLELAEEINEAQQNKLIKELASEIRRIDRLEEKGAISERAAGIEREKLERKKELVEAGLTVEGKEKK